VRKGEAGGKGGRKLCQRREKKALGRRKKGKGDVDNVGVASSGTKKGEERPQKDPSSKEKKGRAAENHAPISILTKGEIKDCFKEWPRAGGSTLMKEKRSRGQGEKKLNTMRSMDIRSETLKTQRKKPFQNQDKRTERRKTNQGCGPGAELLPKT